MIFEFNTQLTKYLKLNSHMNYLQAKTHLITLI
jgi:hypothetical protein